MIHLSGKLWRNSLAALSLAVAASIGITSSFAETATSIPAAAQGKTTPAVDAFVKARELYQQEKYPEAKIENDRALRLDPKFKDALTLRGMIQAKLDEGPGGATAGETTAAPGNAKVRLLKASDISLVRIHEWSPDTDSKLTGRVDRKVLEDFWNEIVRKQDDASATSKAAHDAFLTNFQQQVKRIKDAGEAKYMEKVMFNGDPLPLATFRTKIQPYVMQNCATAACHAGEKAGNFRLIRATNAASDQIIYTNFYILSKYSNADGKMIDRDTPEKSLLFQYGVIKESSKKPHPGKVELRAFVDQSDPRLQAMVEWVKTLTFPPPNYGITYELPGATPAPTPAPASAPASHTRPKTPARTK
jgi:hypothetical protein